MRSSGMSETWSAQHDGNNASKVCLLLDLLVGDFVQAVDVEKITEASETEVV